MRNHIVLFVNGQRCQLSYQECWLTLAEYLRQRGLVGTKIVCNEGDCGACSVLVGRIDQSRSAFEYQTIDSCILFLFQLDRCHVVTVEGLRTNSNLTPIQEAMVRCHGSQCGFCTPGFVVAMHGMVEAGRPLDDPSLRYGLSGNLCRCTGYQQILDAGKSVDAQSVKRIGDLYPDQAMLDQLAELEDGPVRVEGEQTVFVPRTIDQAIDFKASNPAAAIVSGATDHGVLYNHGRTVPSDVLCLTSMGDYDDVLVEDSVLQIGGGATWTKIEGFIQRLFPPYHAIITRFGSPQIRNAGTLAGNLASGSPIADSIPFHLVMDSHIRLISQRGERQVDLNDFYIGYRRTMMADDELIAGITTPLLGPTERLVLYKISKRRDMDISTMTLGLWINLVDDTIENARLALGGVGPTVLRIPESETHLIGKPISESVFQQAGMIARNEITPWSDVRGGAEFRLQLAENLMLKAYHELTGQPLPATS